MNSPFLAAEPTTRPATFLGILRIAAVASDAHSIHHPENRHETILSNDISLPWPAPQLGTHIILLDLGHEGVENCIAQYYTRRTCRSLGW